MTSDNVFSDWLTSLVTFFDNIQLMTFHKVNTVIYQPRGSDVHRSQFNPEEVMFTEANGWGEHHFQGVDKSVSTEMKSHQLFY